MMRHVFPYPAIEPLEIPERHLAGVYSIGAPGSARPSRELV